MWTASSERPTSELLSNITANVSVTTADAVFQQLSDTTSLSVNITVKNYSLCKATMSIKNYSKST